MYLVVTSETFLSSNHLGPDGDFQATTATEQQQKNLAACRLSSPLFSDWTLAPANIPGLAKLRLPSQRALTCLASTQCSSRAHVTVCNVCPTYSPHVPDLWCFLLVVEQTHPKTTVTTFVYKPTFTNLFSLKTDAAFVLLSPPALCPWLLLVAPAPHSVPFPQTVPIHSSTNHTRQLIIGSIMSLSHNSLLFSLYQNEYTLYKKAPVK